MIASKSTEKTVVRCDQLPKAGFNWANQLASYSVVLNEVYYGRRSNRIELRREGSIHIVQQEHVAPITVSIELSLSDVIAFEERRNQHRTAALKATRNCLRRMFRRGIQKNPPHVYKCFEEESRRTRHTCTNVSKRNPEEPATHVHMFRRGIQKNPPHVYKCFEEESRRTRHTYTNVSKRNPEEPATRIQMFRRGIQKNPPHMYKLNEKVLVR